VVFFNDQDTMADTPESDSASEATYAASNDEEFNGEGSNFGD